MFNGCGWLSGELCYVNGWLAGWPNCWLGLALGPGLVPDRNVWLGGRAWRGPLVGRRTGGCTGLGWTWAWAGLVWDTTACAQGPKVAPPLHRPPDQPGSAQIVARAPRNVKKLAPGACGGCPWPWAGLGAPLNALGCRKHPRNVKIEHELHIIAQKSAPDARNQYSGLQTNQTTISHQNPPRDEREISENERDERDRFKIRPMCSRTHEFCPGK